MKKKIFNINRVTASLLLSLVSFDTIARMEETTSVPFETDQSIDHSTTDSHTQPVADDDRRLSDNHLFNPKDTLSNLSDNVTINASASGDVKLGEYIIPSVFAHALQEGLSLPLYVRYKQGNQEEKQKIADALIALSGNKLIIRDVSLVENSDGASLSETTKVLVNSIKDHFFDNNTTIRVSDGADLNLNIKSFVLTLDVEKDNLSTATVSRTAILGKSSVKNLSSVTNYDLGVYHSTIHGADANTNSYLHLDNTLGWSENHFNVRGSFYESGHSNTKATLYKAMYERDFDGRRFAVGMVDTWSLQSIASLSALNTSKVYGVTYGSNSFSKVTNNQQSLTPITVFLPSAGEVRIFRDGRLLNVQNLPMGSFEIDTSSLPYGIYDVDVEVVVDGKSNSKTRQKINKNFSSKGSEINKIDWQAYSGYVDLNNNNTYRKNMSDAEGTYLVGFSAAVTLPVLTGLTFQTSNYAFDKNFINETSVNLGLNQYMNANWQTLVSEKGKNRNIVTLNTNIPGGYGSIWGNWEKGSFDNDLPIYDSNSYSYGGSLNLDQFIRRTGTFTFSQTHDLRAGSKSNNFEYSNALYSGRRFNLSLRAGIQQYKYINSPKNEQKYVSFVLSVPLSGWFSTGITSDNKNVKMDVSANKSFNDSVISSVGLNASKSLTRKNGESDDFSVSGYTAFNGKYGSGTAMVSRPNDRQFNSSLTTRGTIATSGKNIASNGNQEKSGMIIKTGVTGNASLSAQIDGRNYKLTGKNNFIPLPPYATYKVELMNDKHSKDSFSIVRGKTQNVTLYPGNVAVFNPEIKQLVTVFGRVVSDKGVVLVNTPIQNHIGKTVTDAQGEFAMDVDLRYPTIQLVSEKNQEATCEIPLNLNKARGVMWVGDLSCSS